MTTNSYIFKSIYVDRKAESAYNVSYGSSIITSEVHQIVSVMKTKTGVSREMIIISKIIHFGILIHVLSWKTTETPVFMFSLLRLFD